MENIEGNGSQTHGDFSQKRAQVHMQFFCFSVLLFHFIFYFLAMGNYPSWPVINCFCSQLSGTGKKSYCLRRCVVKDDHQKTSMVGSMTARKIFWSS